MNIIFKCKEENTILIHKSFNISVINDFSDCLGLNISFHDCDNKELFVFSKNTNRYRARSIAKLISNNMCLYQSGYSLKKSEKSTEQPLRHSTVDINVSFAERNGLLNNQIAFLLSCETLEIYQCTIHISNKIEQELEIRIPPAMQIIGQSVVLFKPIVNICSMVKSQNASKIKDDTITISESLFNRLMHFMPENIEIRHLATGATMTRPFSLFDYDRNMSDEQIRLNYNQREILNIIDNNKSFRSENYFSTLNDKILRTNNTSEQFMVAGGGSYSPTSIYNQVQIVPLVGKNKQHRLPHVRVCDILVGAACINLSAVRPYKIDDARDIVRLSEDTMTLLGIEEADRIVIHYKGKMCKARAMKIDSFDLLRETNIFDSENDVDLVIGIPAPLRKELGIGDVETEVLIKRDTVYLFNKNLNIQMLSVLGLMLAVFQIGGDNYYIKSLICVLLLPFIIYFTLSQERSKVKQYSDNKKIKKGNKDLN